MIEPSGVPPSHPRPSRRLAAVVTASDRSATGTREDVSGPAVAGLLEAAGYSVVELVVVPDERDRIADALVRLADEVGVALLAVTGGTGFAPRDVTPEATRGVIDREAPGLAEAMRTAASRTTPNAYLSRGVCGVRGTTLILNLPGSPSGATESLAAILALLPHAIAQLTGGDDHAAPSPPAAPNGRTTIAPPALEASVAPEPSAAQRGPTATEAPAVPGAAAGSSGLLARLGRSRARQVETRAAVLERLAAVGGVAALGPPPSDATPIEPPMAQTSVTWASVEPVVPDAEPDEASPPQPEAVDPMRAGAPTTGAEADAAEGVSLTGGRRGLLTRVRDRLAGEDGPATGLDEDLDVDLDADEDPGTDGIRSTEADPVPPEGIAADVPVVAAGEAVHPDPVDPVGPAPRLVSFGWTDDAPVGPTLRVTLDPVSERAGDDAERPGAEPRSRLSPRGDAPSAGGPAGRDPTSWPLDATSTGRSDGAVAPTVFARLAGAPADWGRATVIVAAVIAMLTLLASDQPPITVGEVPLPTVARPSDPADPTAAAGSTPLAPVATTAPPITIRIPTITVDAAVVRVGLEPDGAMEIPQDIRTIGWYDPQGYGGVVPGSEGTAVLSGHVDSRSQGAGAFYYLRNLGLGDEIEVVHEDGTVTRWIVTGRTQYDKDVIPLDEIFVWEGAPRLALITCGGEFDRTERSYRDNIVVLAEPLTV